MCSAYVFSESFIQVSGLVFGSSAHFELILGMILQNFQFNSLHGAVHLLVPLFEETVFSPMYNLASFVEIN